MNLIELRKKFVELSGRYDLADPITWQDQGVDFFINAGSRFLDRRADIVASREAVTVIPVRAGDPELTIKDCWQIHKIEMLAQSSGKDYADRWIPLKPLRNPALRITARQLGVPCGYSLLISRFSPAAINLVATQLRQVPADVMPQSSELYKAYVLQLSPIPSTDVLIKVTGNFYTDALTQDSDTNFWADAYSDTLLKAALYQLEVFYRNTEGSMDWLNSLQMDLVDIEHQELQTFTRGRNQMED